MYVVRQDSASSEDQFGVKSAAIADLQKSALPVPKGFVLTPDALDLFISENGLESKIRSVSETAHRGMTGLDAIKQNIDSLFANSQIPEAVKREVLSAYGNLSLSDDVRRADTAALDLIKVGRNHERVAVRSSIVRGPENSFAGVTSSFLNVTGEDELWKSIKLCWASAFHPHMLLYSERKGVDGLPRMSIIVQRMVDSEKSGSLLTNFIKDKMLIEAAWGLGNAVSSGMVAPDEYLLHGNGALMEKNISKKLGMFVRNAMSGKTEKQPVPGNKMDAQVLSDSELRKLSELAVKVQGSKSSQLQIDWCIARNRVFLLDVKQGNFGIEKRDEQLGEALVTGRCASMGTGSGSIVKYPGDNGNQFDETCIVVSESPSLHVLLAFPDIAGYVSNEGGRLCNFSILARELKVPALTATGNASSILHEGDSVRVLAEHGKVIAFDEQPEPEPQSILPSAPAEGAGTEFPFPAPLPAEPFQTTEQGEPAPPLQPDNDEPSLQQFQPATESAPSFEPEGPALERQPVGTKLFAKVDVGKLARVEGADGYIVTMGSPESGAVAVASDASPDVMSLGSGRLWLQSKGEHDFPLAVDFAKKLEGKGFTGAGVLIPVTRGENDIARWRFQIPGSVRLGVSIRTPAMAQVSGSFMRENIVMANVDLKSLVQLSMGLQRPDNEIHHAVLGMLSNVFESCKAVGAKSCVSIDPDYLNIDNVESLIRLGADCLCVEPALLGNLKDAVSRAERKLLLEKGGPAKDGAEEQPEPAPLAETFLQESPEPDESSPETYQEQNDSGGSEGFFSPSSFSS